MCVLYVQMSYIFFYKIEASAPLEINARNQAKTRSDFC